MSIQNNKKIINYLALFTRNFGGGEFEGSGSVKGVESWTLIFPGGHYLFTSSDTFAVRCIVKHHRQTDET